jgi:hypothetical protein
VLIYYPFQIDFCLKSYFFIVIIFRMSVPKDMRLCDISSLKVTKALSETLSENEFSSLRASFSRIETNKDKNDKVYPRLVCSPVTNSQAAHSVLSNRKIANFLQAAGDKLSKEFQSKIYVYSIFCLT